MTGRISQLLDVSELPADAVWPRGAHPPNHEGVSSAVLADANLAVDVHIVKPAHIRIACKVALRLTSIPSNTSGWST